VTSASFESFHFDTPLWLWLVPAVALAAVVLAAVDRAVVRSLGAAAVERRGRGARRARLTGAAELLGLALLLFALAGPRADALPARTHEPAPCVFVLDASRSMLAEDASPSRFGAACAAIAQRVRAEPGRRHAVVLFSGEAHPLAPPTADGEALVELLGTVDPRYEPWPGSDVGRAIDRAVDLLKETHATGVAEVASGLGSAGEIGEIVVLSDGEWDGGRDPTSAVAAARAAGVKVVAQPFGAEAPAAIVLREGAPLGAPPPVVGTTSAKPDHVRGLERADPASNGGARAEDSTRPDRSAWIVHAFRAFVAGGLLLLAIGHWLRGVER
jgi:Mg-chelatase subunit ChlD